LLKTGISFSRALQAESYFRIVLKSEACQKAGREPDGELLQKFD